MENSQKIINQYLKRLNTIQALFLDAYKALVKFYRVNTPEVYNESNTTMAVAELSDCAIYDNDYPGNEIKFEDIKKRKEEGFRYQITVGVLFIYELWEQKYREMLAEDFGWENKDNIDFPLMGDLRLFRNYLVHPCKGTGDNLKNKSIERRNWYQIEGNRIIVIEEGIKRVINDIETGLKEYVKNPKYKEIKKKNVKYK